MRCCFASTRPVQIATAFRGVRESGRRLCLHTPRADCNGRPILGTPIVFLCLHTPRADCNACQFGMFVVSHPLPPHAPCRLQHGGCGDYVGRKWPLPPHAPCRLQPKTTSSAVVSMSFASTRPVQIATLFAGDWQQRRCLCLHTPRADCNRAGAVFHAWRGQLCLHTPRADCNDRFAPRSAISRTLPPHAPCRLQPSTFVSSVPLAFFASTRPVQIATRLVALILADGILCLHTPRADCNDRFAPRSAISRTLPPHAPCRLQPSTFVSSVPLAFFASTRPVQIATRLVALILADGILCLHTPRADCNTMK